MPDNSAIAEAIFESWEKRDYDAIVETMADDVVVNSPGSAELKGKAAAKDWYASWAIACPDGVAGAKCVGATKDTAVLSWHFLDAPPATSHAPKSAEQA